MDVVIILVRFRQLILLHEERIEPFPPAQLIHLVHLDRFERANFDANLAAHADRNVDVERRRIKLRLAHVIGLLVVALDNVDALRRAFLLANLARHAAQARFGIVVVNQERKGPVILRQRRALLRILHRYEPLLYEITSDEILRRDCHSFEDAGADHNYRSTSPITISTLPRITITSATV